MLDLCTLLNQAIAVQWMRKVCVSSEYYELVCMCVCVCVCVCQWLECEMFKCYREWEMWRVNLHYEQIHSPHNHVHTL